LFFDLLGQKIKNRNKKDLSDPFLFRKEKGKAFFLSFCRVTSNGHTTKGKAKQRKEKKNGKEQLLRKKVKIEQAKFF
jgi:hypothetical protein